MDVVGVAVDVVEVVDVVVVFWKPYNLKNNKYKIFQNIQRKRKKRKRKREKEKKKEKERKRKKKKEKERKGEKKKEKGPS